MTVALTETQYLRLVLAQANLELAQAKALLAEMRVSAQVQAAMTAHEQAKAACGLSGATDYTVDDATFVATPIASTAKPLK